MTIFTDIGHIETFRHEHIELNGPALPGTTDAVFQVEVKFRTVECAITFIDYVWNITLFDDVMKGIGSQFPNFIRTHGVFRTGRQFNMVFQTKLFICFIKEVHNAIYFILDLARKDKEVSIVLRKATYAEETMQGTVKFMAMYQAEFGDTHREITIAVDIALVDENATWAVHRFNSIRFIINGGKIHVIAIMIPVS